MKILLIVISILLIAVVLLQAGKAEGAQSALTGGNDSLFKNRKERGGRYGNVYLGAGSGNHQFPCHLV